MKTTYGKITVDSVKESMKEDRDQAQIRQKVTTDYPSGRQNNSMSDGLFNDDDFGFESQEFASNRVAFLDVPKGTTKEQVEAKLEANPNARIYKTLSSQPILTDEQKNAIKSGITTLEIIKYGESGDKGQVVRYPEDHEEAGEPILHNGAEQFRTLNFSLTAKEDEDYRTSAEAPAEASSVAEEVADKA